jgi:hypothetical protein
MQRLILVASLTIFLGFVLACGGGSPNSKTSSTAEKYWEDVQSGIKVGETVNVQRSIHKGDILEGIGSKLTEDSPWYLFEDMQTLNEFENAYSKNPSTSKAVKKRLIDSRKALLIKDGTMVKILTKNVDMAYITVEVIEGEYANKKGILNAYAVIPIEPKK